MMMTLILIFEMNTMDGMVKIEAVAIEGDDGSDEKDAEDGFE